MNDIIEMVANLLIALINLATAIILYKEATKK